MRSAASQAMAAAAGLPTLALVGNPNCGKTALFNLLTGARQKVANYAGVTVERKEGWARLPDGRAVSVVDLPGVYSLSPTTVDEAVTHDVVMGLRTEEQPPDVIVAVVDATNLRMNLRLVLQLCSLGRPVVMALNMMDVARARGLQIDVPRLAEELGVLVIETVAVHNSPWRQWFATSSSNGREALLAASQSALDASRFSARDRGAIGQPSPPPAGGGVLFPEGAGAALDTKALQSRVKHILAVAVPNASQINRFNHGLDSVVMHPVYGLVLLAALLFMVFQAVFAWANLPMDAIKQAVAAGGDFVNGHMHEGILRSLLVDGIIAGVGSVLVFLPQILILFFFILVLEESGYLPRAAFLLDNLMGKVGLSGRAFIPLLSSFACAIPGIMATRTIPNARDRLATIMIAPLMTCSARLPLYALLIGAFVPQRNIGYFSLQGLTLFGLYVAGIVSAMAVGWVYKKLSTGSHYRPLMLELPPYRVPSLYSVALGLWQRATIFLSRVGTIIFSLMVVLWFLATFPGPPPDATGAAIQYSFAGMIGRALEVVFSPIGFNWQICIALVPGMAAREVAVGALGTVYALSQTGQETSNALSPLIAGGWSLATAYALLAWYVFAPQCLSTLAVVKRETNSWRYPLLMAGYLFALAYVAAFVSYRVTLWLT